MDTITLALAKAYVKEQLIDGGELVGKNVTISSITPIEGGNQITFSYTLDDGTVKEQHLNVMDGKDAYEYAQAGGYTGTEEEFAAKMAQVIPAQIQADWEQNDETASDYVKNKPFGDAESEIVVLEETTVETSDTTTACTGLVDGAFQQYNYSEMSCDSTVIFDNTKYDMQLSQEKVLGIGYLGNISLHPGVGSMYADDGNPFLLINTITYDGTPTLYVKEAGTHTIKVTKSVTEVVQIESKYIPQINYESLGNLPFGGVFADHCIYSAVNNTDTSNTFEDICQIGNGNYLVMTVVSDDGIYITEWSAMKGVTSSLVSESYLINASNPDFPIESIAFDESSGNTTVTFKDEFSEYYCTELYVYQLNSAMMQELIRPFLVQSDWEQNDSTQLDYVKNKPFGNEESETILISEQEVINGSEVSLDSEYEENTEGKEYVVIYDGVKYQTVASMVRVSMMAAQVMIGNPSIMDSTLSTGNNEPFCIILNETYFYMTFEDGSAHMVGVNKIATSIKQIEEKYIPDSIARTEDIPTDDHINELINTALGTNLTEVASLVGGDA